MSLINHYNNTVRLAAINVILFIDKETEAQRD